MKGFYFQHSFVSHEGDKTCMFN